MTTMKQTFFATVESMLQENEILDIRITKNSDILVVMVTPKIKGKTANPIMKGTGAEIDENFFEELNKPVEKMRSFSSNAAEVEIKDAEDDEKEKKPAKKETPKKVESSKKKASVKTKDDKAESTDADQEDDEEESEDTDASGEEAKAGPSAEELEAQNKAAEEKAAKEKAEAEAKEKAALVEEKFTKWMKLGSDAMEARNYEEAEYNFKLAEKLKPEDADVKTKLAGATRWVNALIAAQQPVNRKEVIDGAEYN